MPAKGGLAGRSQLKAIAHWQLGRVVITQKSVKRWPSESPTVKYDATVAHDSVFHDSCPHRQLG